MKKTFIIAEAGVNHNGKLDMAYKLVDVAVNAGVDAVKFQTFKAEKLATKDAPKAAYQKKNMPGKKEKQLEMLKRLELSYSEFRKLKAYCDRKKILFLSTPFDYDSSDFLEKIVPIFKISSGDITNLPFLEYMAKKNKPIILSTGMSTIEEVKRAVEVVQREQKRFINAKYFSLAILHCTSNYPCPYEEVNLRVIKALRESIGIPVGYSDHTLGIEVSLAAVAMGAEIIEKHFTLNRNMKGPDHKASIEPDELSCLVKGIRNVEKALGNSRKSPSKSEIGIMQVSRKSLVASRSLKKGNRISEDMFLIKRPGKGIQPLDARKVIGRKLIRNKNKNENIFWEDLE